MIKSKTEAQQHKTDPFDVIIDHLNQRFLVKDLFDFRVCHQLLLDLYDIYQVGIVGFQPEIDGRQEGGLYPRNPMKSPPIPFLIQRPPLSGYIQ